MLNKPQSKKYFLATVIFVIVLIFLGLTVMIVEVYIPSLHAQHPVVRLAVQKILVTQLVSKFDGNYWENEMCEQGQIIRQLPVKERLNFYLLVLLNCELDTSRSLMFTEIIGSDALQFKNYLISYREKPSNGKLNPRKRALVDGWIYEMGVVCEQQKQHK